MLIEANKTQVLTLITQKESTISSDVSEEKASKVSYFNVYNAK